MKFLRDIYREGKAEGRPVISFEFFPTKTERGEEVFFEKTIPRLKKLNPDFCSVTYGAGGSTRDKTLDIVDRIQKEFGLTTMAHLTCVNATREDTIRFLNDAKSRGIKNILALRGDPPGGEGEFVKTEGGFEYSYELVQLVKEMGGFSIGTAGFPEGHVACKEGKYVDWGHLKTKIDCGADAVLTQLFFDNADYFEFRDHLVNKLGVTVPLVPGILPVLNTRQIKRFTELCGARIPEPMLKKLNELSEDDEAVTQYGIDYATQQIEDLLKAGVEGIHLYTLNKARSVTAILKNLNLA